jgi:hypothetical protein
VNRAGDESRLFGVEGRELLARLRVPQPWRGNVTASVALIDDLEGQIAEINRKLREGHADHPYIPLPVSAPGIGWLLAFTIARRDRRDRKVRVTREARRLHRPLPRSSTPPTPSATSATSAGSANNAAPRSPQLDTARRLTHAIWHMLTRHHKFAPQGAAVRLGA